MIPFILPNALKREGACVCGTSIEQVEINPEFLAARSDGMRELMRREFYEDPITGKMFTPKGCSLHDRERRTR